MSTGTLEIHSENILPIIKKWLYSDKDIFVRELVSNSCDATNKLKYLRDRKEATVSDTEFPIKITIDKEAKTLTFSDKGLGMDADEIVKYIAQIAFSGAEDFVERYKTNDEKEQFIGHFGLGFYSTYMVANKVEIQTLSYKEDAKPVFWSCDGSTSYTLEDGSRTTRGTDVILHINEENEEFLEESRLNHILTQYCSFLPVPVYLNETHINKNEPLWVKSPADCTEKDYLDFYRQLHPFEQEPLFWVHLNVDYPFNLKGILYFPKIKQDFNYKKSAIKLYCNRVFVTDQCQDLIPEYLMVLQGVIDSPDIPLNVSRSYLQMDRTVKQLSGHISKKIADSLNTLFKTNHEKFLKIWPDVEIIVKLGILEDDKFYGRVKDLLTWKNSKGEFTTITDYIERNKEKNNKKVFYTDNLQHAKHCLDIYEKQGIEVLVTNPLIDGSVVGFLENKLTEVSFQRIDAGIDDSLIDKSKEQTVLDADGKSVASHLADFIRGKLSNKNIEVEAKSLASENVHALVTIDEQQRRMRDYMQRSGQGADMLSNLDMAKQTFTVNTNSPLFETIQALDKTNPELATEMIKQVYELSLLSQRELSHDSLNSFVERSSSVLEQLAKEATKEK